jgi:uncharacterized protein involved in type VI secretion and phage assembly
MQGQHDKNVVIGIVTDLDDPDRIGRVRVKFPYLNDQPSYWARLVSPMAGAERGLFCRPEVDDEVLVVFEHGDQRRPYVLGALWSKADRPPPDDGKPRQNNWRLLRSRSGHVIKLDDTKGAEKVEITDRSGKIQIVFDCAANKLRVVCDTGDVEVKAQGAVKVEAGTDVEIKAGASMTLQATGTLTIKGAKVNIN